MSAEFWIALFWGLLIWLWGHHLRVWRYRKPRHEIPEFVRQGRPRL